MCGYISCTQAECCAASSSLTLALESHWSERGVTTLQLGPWAKFSPLSVSFFFFFLICLPIFCKLSKATAMLLLCVAVFAKLHNCNRDRYGAKPKTSTICLFTEKKNHQALAQSMGSAWLHVMSSLELRSFCYHQGGKASNQNQ